MSSRLFLSEFLDALDLLGVHDSHDLREHLNRWLSAPEPVVREVTLLAVHRLGFSIEYAATIKKMATTDGSQGVRDTAAEILEWWGQNK